MLSTTSVLFSQNTGTLSLTKGAVSHEGLVIKLIQRAEVIVRLALIAGDGRGQGSEAAQHHQDTQIQLHGSLYGVICIKLYSLPACCNISLLTAWAALVALTLRDLASTMGVLLVQYSFCKQSTPTIVARLCLCLSVSYWQRYSWCPRPQPSTTIPHTNSTKLFKSLKWTHLVNKQARLLQLLTSQLFTQW